MNTAGLISDFVKPEIALQSASQGSGGTTGRYFKAGDARKMLFLLEVGALTDVQTSVLQLVQATDAAGTAVKDITNATVTISNTTQNTLTGAYKAKVTFATFLADSEITVNGVTFAAKNTASDFSAGEVGIYGLTDDQVAAEFAEAFNDPDYGLEGVTATAAGSGGVLNFTVDEPGEATIDITGVATTGEPAIVAAAAFVELDCAGLDSENGFTHVAAKVTNTANTQCSVSVLLAKHRYSPSHEGMAGTKTNLDA